MNNFVSDFKLWCSVKMKKGVVLWEGTLNHEAENRYLYDRGDYYVLAKLKVLNFLR